MTSRPMGRPVSNLSVDGAWGKTLLYTLGFINALQHQPGRLEFQLVRSLWDPLHVTMAQHLEQTLCLQGRHSNVQAKLFSKYFWTSNLTFWTQKPRKAPLRPLRKRRSFSVWGKITFVSFVLKDHAKLQQYAQLMRVSLSIYLYLYNNFPISDSRSR